MRAHMRGHGRALRKLASAYFARERLLARVCAQMSGQIGGLRERLVALVALVRLFARVRPHVGLERAGSCVCLVAYATPIHAIQIGLTATSETRIHITAATATAYAAV